jgi:TolB-like protein/DNA-binding winged helix-turn-helix (wHTH) protein
VLAGAETVMTAPSERMLEVRRGRFDPLSGELYLDGRMVRLRPRTAALLACLVQRRDRVVTKHELMELVWPDAVVTEDSLVQCIKEIRQAIGEEGREWIRTVPRHGYAFVPEIPLSGSADGPQRPSTPAGQGDRSPKAIPVQRLIWPAMAVIALLIAAAITLSTRPTTRELPPALSLVVLPIANQTDEASWEHLADEMTEHVTNALSQMDGTWVISPGTAFTYKGSSVDVRRVGAELGVRYVLESTLRSVDARTRLSVRLADASSAVQLWIDEFDADEARASALQDEVIARVANSLGLRLFAAEAHRTRREPSADRTATDLLTRARVAFRSGKQDRASMAEARALLEETVRRDDQLAEAWGLLARATLAFVRFSSTREQDVERARIAADRAVSLAPDNALGHLARAWVHYESKRMPQALASFDRAIELRRNDPHLLGGRSAALIMLGRPDEAVEPIEKAMRLSPRDPALPTWQMIRGVADLHRGQPESAAEWLAQAVAAEPGNTFTHLFLASALGGAGRLPEARAQLDRFHELAPGFTLKHLKALEPSDTKAFRSQREGVYEGLRRAGMSD